MVISIPIGRHVSPIAVGHNFRNMDVVWRLGQRRGQVLFFFKVGEGEPTIPLPTHLLAKWSQQSWRKPNLESPLQSNDKEGPCKERV